MSFSLNFVGNYLLECITYNHRHPINSISSTTAGHWTACAFQTQNQRHVVMICARIVTSTFFTPQANSVKINLRHAASMLVLDTCTGTFCFRKNADKRYQQIMHKFHYATSTLVSTEQLRIPIIIFIWHNQAQKSVPNCDVSFANGELHQAYGHVTLTTSAWPKYGHRSLVGCRLPRLFSYSWPLCVCSLTPCVVLFSNDLLCLRSWHRTNQWHDSLLPRGPLWLTC